MPSPNLIAAMLVPRTRCRIAILGNAISLRDHPLRVAEEIAMLDVISGGRVISGFVRGIGAEYHSFSLDPNESRERFQEAHDLIVKAWTQAGPFEWYGKHYKFRYVNPWPRPMQQPHPPIWSPHLEFLFNTLIRMPKDMFYPAGYLSETSARRVLSSKAGWAPVARRRTR